MELRDNLRTIQRRWLLVLAPVVVMLSLAVIVNLLTTPQYMSRSQLFISNSTSSGKNSSADYTEHIASYASLVSDDELAGRVVDALNLDVTPGQLGQRIKAQVVPNTLLLEIEVTDADPKVAQRINKEVVHQLQGVISAVEKPSGTSTPLLKAVVVAPSTSPTSPVATHSLRNLLLGGLLGLLLGLAAVAIRELVETSRGRHQEPVDGLPDVEEDAPAPRSAALAGSELAPVSVPAMRSGHEPFGGRTLLDEFLDDGHDLGESAAYDDPQDPDDAPDDKTTMWRPSRWIGS